MLNRDYIKAEIEKLAQVLAKLIGLKDQEKRHEYENLFQQTLEKSFGINDFRNLSVADFELLLRSKNFLPEQLDLLSQFLFLEAHPIDSQSPIDLLNKILVILDLLEKEHHIQTLDNIDRRRLIEKYIKTHE